METKMTKSIPFTRWLKNPSIPRVSETQVVNFVFGVSPWITPLVTAWIVLNACQSELKWDYWQALVGAIIIEINGISSANLLMFLYQRHAPKRVVWIGATIFIVYIAAVLFLTIFLEVAPALALGAPAVFVALVASSNATLVVRAYVKSNPMQPGCKNRATLRNPVAEKAQPDATAKQRLLILLQSEPNKAFLSAPAMAKEIKTSRQNLEKFAHKNGQGWELKVK